MIYAICAVSVVVLFVILHFASPPPKAPVVKAKILLVSESLHLRDATNRPLLLVNFLDADGKGDVAAIDDKALGERVIGYAKIAGDGVSVRLGLVRSELPSVPWKLVSVEAK